MNRRRFLAGSVLSVPTLYALNTKSASAETLSNGNFNSVGSPEFFGVQSVRDLYIPRPQFWSFDNDDPRFSVAGYSFSFQVYTYGPNENTYSLERSTVQQQRSGDTWTIRATSLSWPRQQLPMAGTFEAVIRADGKRVSLQLSATTNEKIRGIKVIVHDLPKGRVGQTGWDVEPYITDIPKAAINFNYPEYQGGMPVWFLETQNSRGVSFSSLDQEPRPKRFIVYPQGQGVTAALMVDQDGRRLTNRFDAPEWVIERDTTLDAAIDARATLLGQKAGLKRWEDRQDVPMWARDVSLVVTLHGMHWSGCIFNDYAKMLRRVRWITDRIEGRRVMFFLAGWEGRYYRRYGDSHANERMGGADGLQRLVQGIHQRGSHVMAMFGGNYPSPGLPDYDRYAKGSAMDALPANLQWDAMRGYVVDWGEIRAGASGGPKLNPGAPGWQDWLTNQIAELNKTYGFDGNFLDTQPNGENDMRYSPLEGLRSIADRLRSQKDDLLLATESWFDLSLGIIPASQTPDGPFHWSKRYQRRWAHVSMGEPSRGSTGVHELGHIPYRPEELLALYDWPTVAIVEDTIERAPEKVQAVLQHAKKSS